MKILVPVDFQETSYNALRYASNFAKKVGGSITMLKVINGSFNTNEVIQYDPLLNMEEAALKRLKYFSSDYPKEVNLPLADVAISHEVRFGIPGFRIARFADEYDFDLIIMGTRDKHGIFDRLLGSTSSIAIRVSECPVLLIHRSTVFNDIEKIAFAFDSKGDLEDAIENFKNINNSLKAQTDFVHVNRKRDAGLTHQMEEIVEELFDDSDPKFSFEIQTVDGVNVRTALKDYCLFQKVDMLALMHRNEGVFSNLFSSDSVKLAQEFHLPVMVFHE